MLERFKEVFAGLETAYGQTKVTDELSENGKHEAKSFTKKENVTDLLWNKHLKGEEPALGIVPIREDNKCKWGCIDIDTYPFDHKSFIKKIRDKRFPLILFRSKSGGAHVFLFTKEFVPASLMRERLKKIAGALGYAKTEIFPKQDYIRADRGDIGSFLNVPYHGSNKSVRYAFDDNGEPVKLENFFKLYDEHSITEKELLNLKVNEESTEDEFLKGAPPCLLTLLKDGIPEGNRDNMMYNIGVYLKKRYPDAWQDKMQTYNQKYMRPPLSHEIILKKIASVGKHDYKYKCKDAPIVDFCNAKTCSKKEFGVGEDIPGPEITGLSKYLSDPPIYFLTIDGKTVELDDVTLHDYEKLSVACMNQISLPLLPIGKIIWRKQLAKLFLKLEELEAPDSLKLETEIKDIVHNYIYKSNGKSLEDVVKGVPYVGDDNTYIKWNAFWSHVKKTKVWSRNREKTFTLLKTLFDAEEKHIRIEKSTTRVIVMSNKKLEKPNKPDIRINKMKDPAFK